VDGDYLPTVLKALAANVEKMFGLPCALTFKGELPPLSAHTVLQLYKIGQEAISNAIKHGKCTKVCLSVCRAADQLALTIRNDGVPFSPPADPKARMGLRIMNYRARTVGATFDIEPNQKNGTIVTCLLPIRTGPSPIRPATGIAARQSRAEMTLQKA